MSELAAQAAPAAVLRSINEAIDLQPTGLRRYVSAASDPNDQRSLYGGLVAAQALAAAAATVEEGRVAHSLHGYYLRPGTAMTGVEFEVDEGRDGRQYSTRSVTASQGGKVIFSMTSSFQVITDGPDYQRAHAPQAAAPEGLPGFALDPRMLDLDARVPHDPEQFHKWPTRLWIRVDEPLGDDPNTHAVALTFISDMCTGLSKAPEVHQVGILPSLDHALWIHRPVDMNDWVLMDLTPESTGNGRGLYTGRIFDRSGTLIASLAQESLFKVRPRAQWVRP